MKPTTYSLMGGVIFGVVAIVHVLRLAFHLPVHVGEFDIPMWGSWIGAFVTGLLCFLGFMTACRK